MQPLVSAVVTSYNHERYLEKALRSALAQKVDGLEVLVIDDASSDGSRAIVERLAGDPRLRVELHERNLGISPVFNRGLELARGRYVAFLGSDDYWLPDHLAPAVAQLEREGGAMLYGRARLVDESDRDVTEQVPLFRRVAGERVLAELLEGPNFIPFITVVMDRECALAAGGFDERLETLQDYDLWIRLAARHPVRFRDEVSAAFRWDGRNASAPGRENSLRFRRELQLVLEKTLRDLADCLPPEQPAARIRRRVAQNQARLARRVVDPQEQLRAWGKAVRYAPWDLGRWPPYLRALVRHALR